MEAAPRHRNSIGYVIDATRRDEAMIVFGRDSSGNLVGIDEAERGAAQGLRCECGTNLVAKKGEVLEHHFAHKAGEDRSCAVATRAALIRFISDTLLDGGEIELPFTDGRLGSAKVFSLEELPNEQVPTLKIDAQRDRQLIVVFKIKRQKLDRDRYKQQGISAIAVDLSKARNGSDDRIREAILSRSPREWLFRHTRPEEKAGDLKRLRSALFPGLHFTS